VSSGLPRDLDQARLRPHLRERSHLEQKQADIFRREYRRATGEGRDASSPRWKMPVGDDLERLRGLPAVAPGVRGVVKGTDPLGELLAKERRRR